MNIGELVSQKRIDRGLYWQQALNLVAGCTHVSEACLNCLGGDTLILYADYTWRPLKNAKVGDRIIGFDESTSGHGQSRLFRKTTILKIWKSTRSAIKITTQKTNIIASENHLWLSGLGARWLKTINLGLRSSLRNIGTWEVPYFDWKDSSYSESYMRGYIAGMTTGDGTFKYNRGQGGRRGKDPRTYWRVALADKEPLKRLQIFFTKLHICELKITDFKCGKRPKHHKPMMKVRTEKLSCLKRIDDCFWDDGSEDYAFGFISGFYDAEGSSSHGNIRVSQKDQEILGKFVKLCHRVGFNFDFEKSRQNRIRTARFKGKWFKRAEFFGKIQSTIKRKVNLKVKKEAITYHIDPVIELKYVGERRLFDITTSTKTFIANGLLTHNCWSARQAHLQGKRHGLSDYQYRLWGGLTTERGKWTGEIRRLEENFAKLRKNHKPTLWAVWNDLFHPDVPSNFIARSLGAMAGCEKDFFLILTKRSERMLHVMTADDIDGGVKTDAVNAAWQIHRHRLETWPIKNVGLGVTVEHPLYERRVTDLINTPAALRFLSLEPLLGEVSLCEWCTRQKPQMDGRNSNRHRYHPEFGGYGEECRMNKIDWVIMGCESGPKRRHTEPRWFDTIIRDCKHAGVPVFLKQMQRGGKVIHAPKMSNGEPLLQFPEVEL